MFTGCPTFNIPVPTPQLQQPYKPQQQQQTHQQQQTPQHQQYYQEPREQQPFTLHTLTISLHRLSLTSKHTLTNTHTHTLSLCTHSNTHRVCGEKV